MAEFNYNGADHEPAQGDFDPIPVGDYEMAITGSEIKETKAGTGRYIAFTIEILGPSHKGRKVWANINVENPNQQAVDIGLRELRSICDAVGLAGFRDTSELHDRPFVGRIKHETFDGKVREKVATWKKSGGYTPVQSKPAPVQSASADKPWLK